MGKTRTIANLVSNNVILPSTDGKIAIGTNTEPSQNLDVVGIISSTTISGGHYDGNTLTTNSADNFSTTGIITTTGQYNGGGEGLVGVAFTTAAVIVDRKTEGVDGGSASGQTAAWNARDLNFIMCDPEGIVKDLSSNQFTLGRGSYIISFNTTSYRSNFAHAALYNVTNTIYVAYHTNAWSQSGEQWGQVALRGTSYMQNIYSDTVYEVRYNPDQYLSGGGANLSKGISCDFGDDIEQYTMVYILKGNL